MSRRPKGIPPRQYFTRERVEARQQGEHPEVLFHFTPRSRAVKILEDGFLRGRPQLSVTENPAFIVPGPVVFVLDPACVSQKGYEFWPHVWTRHAQEEAEWIVVPRGSEGESESPDVPHATKVPLDCVRYVGLIGRHGAERQQILEMAQERGLEVGDFDWEDWWQNGATH